MLERVMAGGTWQMAEGTLCHQPSAICPDRSWLALTDQHGGSHDCSPQPFLIPDGRLRDVLRADNLIGEAVHFFFLVPALVGIELESQRRGQHLGRQFFGVIPGSFFVLAKAVVLGQIAVQLRIAGNGDADSGRDEPMGLSCGCLGHDDEGDLAGFETFDTLTAGHDAAARGEDARHTDEIARGDARRTKCQLERRQLFAMLTDALGEEHFLRNEVEHGLGCYHGTPPLFRTSSTVKCVIWNGFDVSDL